MIFPTMGGTLYPVSQPDGARASTKRSMFSGKAHPNTIGGEEEPVRVVGEEGIYGLDPDQA